MTTRRTILPALLALLTACSSTRVFTSEAPGASFGSYRTYGFMEPLDTDEAQYSSILSELLELAASRELEARGYTLAEEPDLLVNFKLDTRVKTQTQTTGPVYAGRARYGGYAGYETTTYEYTEGTLHVDLVDRGRNQLAWEGVLVGRITESAREQLRETVDKALAEVFRKYPYEAGRGEPVDAGSR